MTKRSAEHSIKGYLYQFLHTIHDILSQSDDKNLNTVEGIEDLDVMLQNDETELSQYKYHELTKFSNSKVGKPIGIMFNHFISNQTEKYTYKLIIYTMDDHQSIDLETLEKILELKAAKDYIDFENKEYCSDPEKIEEFYNKFTHVSAQRIDDLEQTTIKKIIDVFEVSDAEAEFNLFPLAIKEINNMATRDNKKERQITTREFISKINRKKSITDMSYISRMYTQDTVIDKLKKRIEMLGLKPNRSEYVFFLEGNQQSNSASLILKIAQIFYYNGNKNDLLPVTFIIKNSNNIESIKQHIVEKMIQNNTLMIFNDGLEKYKFYAEYFNRIVITSSKIPGRIDMVNYNFRILSYETFTENKKDIQFSNPTFFCTTKIEDNFLLEYDDVFYIDTLETENILAMLGG